MRRALGAVPTDISKRLIAPLAVAAVLLSITTADSAVVGLWQFDEASGDAVDSSGNGNTGAIVGSVSRVAGMNGSFGNAASFVNDGSTSDYFEVPASVSLKIGTNAGDPWSVAAWVNEADSSESPGTFQSVYGTLLHYRRTLSDEFPYPTPDYGLTFQSGAEGDSQLYLWHGSNSSWQHGTGITPVFNTWVHYAYVYDGTDLKVYVNGTQQFTTNVGAADASYTGYNGALQIGGAPGFTADRNWNGQLDDVAVFNQALGTSDLTTIMGGDFSAYIDPFPPTTSSEWIRDGAGTWSNTLNWDPIVPSGNDQTAILGSAISSPSTVVLDSDRTVKNLWLNSSVAYTVAGTGTLNLQADSGHAGILTINPGGTVTHQITSHVTLDSDTDVSLAADTTLEVNNQLNLGAFNLTKTGAGTLRLNNVVSSTGGVVSASAGVVAGGGSIGGDLVNDGATVAPGNSPGVLTVGGDYRQSAAGLLQMELAGDQRGTQYDVLAIGGAAVLEGGTLKLILRNGFQPHVGEVFDILDFGSFSGGFDHFILPSGWVWDTSRLDVDGTLSVTGAVPEPSAAVLSLLAACAMLARRRARAGRN